MKLASWLTRHPAKSLISESQPPRSAFVHADVKWLPAWRWMLHEQV